MHFSSESAANTHECTKALAPGHMSAPLPDSAAIEVALKASELRYRRLFEAAQDGILILDAKTGIVVDVNPFMVKMLGCSHTVFLGKKVWELGFFKDLVANEAHFMELQRKGYVRYENVPLEARDGSRHEVEFISNVYRVNRRKVIQCNIRDITQRKRSEQTLRASEQQYRSLFEAIDAGFCVIEMINGPSGRAVDYRFVEVNPAFGKHTGLQQAQGKAIRQLVPDHDAHWSEIFGKVARTGAAIRFQSPSAALRRHFDVFAFRIGGDASQRVGVLFNDITAQKEAEKRTRVFQQEIIAAREEERKQVSSVLHHDVGSLAVGISAQFDAIEGDLRSGKFREVLRQMKSTRKLFNEAVVRLKEVAVQLRTPELDVLGLRHALRQYFAHVSEQGGLRIHFRDDLGRRQLAANISTTLFRIAQEALTNAITHGHATRVDVDLEASKAEVRLRLHNNGKKFNPSESSVRAPAWLGLRVMREMATAAGGTFAIISQRGKGTTAWVSLPLKTAAAGPRNATVGAGKGARSKPTRSAGRKAPPRIRT